MADLATLAIKVENGEVIKATTSLDSMTVAGAKTEAATQRLTRRMALAEIEARNMDKALEQAGRSSFRLTGGMGGLASAMQAVAGALVVREVIRMADAYANLHSRLGLVTSGTADLARVQAQLFAVSQSTRTGMESNVALFASIVRSTKALGLSQQDLVGITRTVSQSFLISGASALETNAAVRQLAQALASGVLRGDEFNSIAENAPRLQQAVAESLGVTIGQLRAMAAEGKITAGVITKALMDSGAAINAEFAQIPTTVGGAMVQVRNAMLMAVGAVDSAQGSSAGLAHALTSLAKIIPSIAATANAFFGGIGLMAADAAIGLEKLTAGAHRLQTGFAMAIRDVPGMRALADSLLAQSAAQIKDSDDVIRFLEAKRALLVSELTTIPKVTALSTTHGKETETGTKLTKEQIKALKELAAIRSAAIDAADRERFERVQSVRDLHAQVEAQERLLAATMAGGQALRDYTDAEEARQIVAKTGIALGEEGYEQAVKAAHAIVALTRATKEWKAAAPEGLGSEGVGMFIAGGIVKQITDAAERAKLLAKEMQRHFSDAFFNIATRGIQSFRDMFVSIRDMFLRLAADLAAAKLMEKLTKKGPGADDKSIIERVSGALGGAGVGDLVVGLGIIGAGLSLLGRKSDETAQALDRLRASFDVSYLDFTDNTKAAKFAREQAAYFEETRKLAELSSKYTVEEYRKLATALDEAHQRHIAELEKDSTAIADHAKAILDAARALGDLNVRHLNATGQSGRGGDMAFQNQQRREYEDAQAAGRSPAYLGQLSVTQGDERAWREVQKLIEAETTAIQTGLRETTSRLDDQIRVAQDALKVNEDQLRTAERSVDALRQVVENLRSFKDSLVLSDLSTLSPAQQVTEARRQLDTLYAKAQAGDVEAGGGFGAAARQFLTASRGYNASGAAYVQDFAAVQAMTDALEGRFGKQLTTEEQALDQLVLANQKLVEQIAALQSAKDAAQRNADAAIAALNDQKAVAERVKVETIAAIERSRATVLEPAESLMMALDALRSSVSEGAQREIDASVAVLQQNRVAVLDASNAQIEAIRAGASLGELGRLEQIRVAEQQRLDANTRAYAQEAALQGQRALMDLQLREAQNIYGVGSEQTLRLLEARDKITEQIRTVELARQNANQNSLNEIAAIRLLGTDFRQTIEGWRPPRTPTPPPGGPVDIFRSADYVGLSTFNSTISGLSTAISTPRESIRDAQQDLVIAELRTSNAQQADMIVLLTTQVGVLAEGVQQLTARLDRVASGVDENTREVRSGNDANAVRGSGEY